MKNLKGMALAILLLLAVNTSHAKCIAYDETGGKVTALENIPLHGTWTYSLYNPGQNDYEMLKGVMVFYKGLHVSRSSDAIHKIERMVESPFQDKGLENDYVVSSGGASWGAYIPAVSDADSILRYLGNRKLTLARESVIGKYVTFTDMDLCKFDYRGDTSYYFSLNMGSLYGDQLYTKILFKKISDEPIPSYTSNIRGVSQLNLNHYVNMK